MHAKPFYSLFVDAFNEWSLDKAPRLGAALAYYSAFSVAPLVIIAIGVASMIFGEEAAQKGIVHEIEGTVGEPVAKAIEQMLVNNRDTGRSVVATIIGIATLLFGATGVFGQLQDAMNTVWKVKPKPGMGIWGFIHDRFFSLTMVFGTGFLLLISLIVSAFLAALANSWGDSLPGGAVLWQWVQTFVSFAIITLLFAAIFKYVPDVKVQWRDVWLGALLTAIFFTLGKMLLGWYLGRASTTSEFGAAGSLVVILLWVYYTSQILLYGAEFTRVYAGYIGDEVKPAPNAVPMTQDDLAREGTTRTTPSERGAPAEPMKQESRPR
jgi:membrane protein